MMRTFDAPSGRPLASGGTGTLVLVFVLCLVFSLIPTSLDHLNADLFGNISLDEGSSVRQLQILTLFFLTVWIAYRNQAAVLNNLRATNPFLLALLVFCAVSALWSGYPLVTIKRTFVLGVVILMAVAIAPPMSAPRQNMRILLYVLTAICGASVVVSVLIPSIGVDYQLGGAWRGVTWQKNTLGTCAGYAVLLWIREIYLGERSKVGSMFWLLLCMLVLVMAKSSTSILVTGLGIVLYLLFQHRWFKEQRLGLISLLAICLLVMAVLHFFYVTSGRMLTWEDIAAPIAGLFGKGTDFTGRTNIWALLMVAIQQHLTLGTGYGAFWLGENSPAQYIADALYWMPPQAHNGYLDITNELGLVGIALFVGLIVWHIRNLSRLLTYSREDAAMHIAIIFIILIRNVSESDLLSGINFQNIVFVCSCVEVSTRVRYLRQQSAKNGSPFRQPDARLRT